jgi:hypothetical protein
MVDRSIVMLVYQRVNLGEINSIFMIKSHPKCYVPISSREDYWTSAKANSACRRPAMSRDKQGDIQLEKS